MENKRLSIVEVSDQPASSKRIPSRRVKRQEMQAKYERLWLINPKQYDPTRNCMQRERLERTFQLIQEYVDLSEKQVVDLGCAVGTLSRRLRDAGAKVQAVDIASNALKHLQQHNMLNIEAIQDVLPETALPDVAYDLVVSTDVIAELKREDYRLYFAELARLVKRNGHVVCSTSIDIGSEDALQKLAELAHTEFNILKWVYSYNALYLRLKRFFKAPSHYVKAFSDLSYRQSELQKLSGISRFWFQWNSMLIPALFWIPVSYLTNPLVHLLRQNKLILLKLEKVCRFFSDEDGISHAIFIAQRRPLEIPEMQERPIERPKKREVWE